MLVNHFLKFFFKCFITFNSFLLDFVSVHLLYKASFCQVLVPKSETHITSRGLIKITYYNLNEWGDIIKRKGNFPFQCISIAVLLVVSCHDKQ